jgi:hypothetical protein
VNRPFECHLPRLRPCTSVVPAGSGISKHDAAGAAARGGRVRMRASATRGGRGRVRVRRPAPASSPAPAMGAALRAPAMGAGSPGDAASGGADAAKCELWPWPGADVAPAMVNSGGWYVL